MMAGDESRQRTRDLIAALHVATGEVVRSRTVARKGILGFSKPVDPQVPPDLEVYAVIGNLSADLAPGLTRWFDHPGRARRHLVSTPTSFSWSNLVERWFTALGERRWQPGIGKSVDDLVHAIVRWSEQWIDDPKPFDRHELEEQTAEKAGRGRNALHPITSEVCR